MLQPPITLRMLGPFVLRAAGRRIVLPPGVERVVAFVALQNGPASRSSVAGNLWLDTPEDRAMANLRSALWRLRRPGLPILEGSAESLTLSPHVGVDTEELIVVAHQLLDGVAGVDGRKVDQLAKSSDLLVDWYDDWVVVEREHFRQIRLQALDRLAVELAARGQFGRAAEIALAAVASEPLRESAHRALIAVHLAQGNRSEAIRQYAVFRRIMRDELDLEPSRQMDELIGRVPDAAIARVLRPVSAR